MPDGTISREFDRELPDLDGEIKVRIGASGTARSAGGRAHRHVRVGGLRKFTGGRYCRPMSAPGDVRPEILNRLRPICRALPETYEEPAWIGVRWRIRKRTIVHVYTAVPERNLFYPRHLVAGEPPTLMTFRVPADDLLGLTGSGFPFFRAGWGHNVAGAFLGDHTDWTEIAELLTDSYCEMAPKFLAARILPAEPTSPQHLRRVDGTW